MFAVVIKAAAGVVGKLALQLVYLGVSLDSLALVGSQIVAVLTVFPLQLADARILISIATLEPLVLLLELVDAVHAAIRGDHLLQLGQLLLQAGFLCLQGDGVLAYLFSLTSRLAATLVLLLKVGYAGLRIEQF